MTREPERPEQGPDDLELSEGDAEQVQGGFKEATGFDSESEVTEVRAKRGLDGSGLSENHNETVVRA